MKERRFNVELTKAENGYNFTGEWDNNFIQTAIEAVDEEEAIEFAKDYLVEYEEEPSNYIFRAKEI